MELLTPHLMEEPGVDCVECWLLGHPDENPPHVSSPLISILVTGLKESEIIAGGVELLLNIHECLDSMSVKECDPFILFLYSKHIVHTLNNVMSTITPLSQRTEWE